MTMTTESDRVTELEQILNETVADIKDEGITVTDSEVEEIDRELWGYVWIEPEPESTLEKRKATVKETLRERVNADAEALTTVVNINYSDAGDSGVSVWWN